MVSTDLNLFASFLIFVAVILAKTAVLAVAIVVVFEAVRIAALECSPHASTSLA